MSSLAVTGGTGFVGSHVLRMATNAGYRLRALTRKDRPPYEGINWIAGRLSDPASLDPLAQGANAVIHIAGAIRAGDRAGFAASNIKERAT